MSQATALLILAIHLLTMVANNPNLSDAYRQEINQVANAAIVAAQDAMSTTTPVTSNSSGTIQPVVPQVHTHLTGALTGTMTEDQSAIVVTNQGQIQGPNDVNGAPFGTYWFNVTVLDANGNPVPHVSIQMTGDGSTTTRTADTVNGLNGTNYHTTFSYEPQSQGDKSFTFTSGNLTQTLELTI